MRALEHTQALGGTAACVLRGVNATCTFTHIEDATMEDDEDIGSDSSPFFTLLIAGLVQSNLQQMWGKLATTVALSLRPHTQEAQSFG